MRTKFTVLLGTGRRHSMKSKSHQYSVFPLPRVRKRHTVTVTGEKSGVMGHGSID